MSIYIEQETINGGVYKQAFFMMMMMMMMMRLHTCSYCNLLESTLKNPAGVSTNIFALCSFEGLTWMSSEP